MGQSRAGEGVGWRGWPTTPPQLSTLARGLVDLERAASLPWGWAATVDLTAVAEVAKTILGQRGAICHNLRG